MRALLVVPFAIFAVFAAGSARAQEKERPGFHRLAVTTDVVGVALANRFGVALEAVVARHDSFVLNGWYLASESSGHAGLLDGNSSITYDVQTRAFGGEISYRRYFGPQDGAKGFFISPGFLLAHYVTDSLACQPTPGIGGESTCGSTPPLHQAWGYYGPSFDVGGQGILPIGLVLSGSLGFHYRTVIGSYNDGPFPWGWTFSHGDGFRPRLRLSVGWAFM